MNIDLASPMSRSPLSARLWLATVLLLLVAVVRPVGAVPALVPGAPTGLQVDAVGNGSASISFLAPASDGGSPISNYEYSTNNGGSWTPRSPISTSTSFTLTGLVNGVSYQVKVRAVNFVGSGAESSAATATPAAGFPATGTIAAETYLAVGDSGTILTSADGATWTSQTAGTSASLRGVAAKAGTAVAVGQHGTVLFSADGTSWTTVNGQPAADIQGLRGVAASSTRFVAVGGLSTGSIYFSDEGGTWTAATLGAVGKLRGVIHNGTKFVAVGESGTILTSSDGATWTAQTSGTVERLDGIVWTGAAFQVVSSTGKFLSSTDGVTWNAPETGNAPAWVEGMAWSATRVVMVGVGGRIRTSDDGTAWIQRAPGGGTTLHGVTFAGTFAPQTTITASTLFGNLRKLSATGFATKDKAYDGTRTANVFESVIAVLVGVFTGDTVTLSGNASVTGEYDTAAVGTNKTITLGNLSISDTSNYTLSATILGNITSRNLTVTANNATKTYGSNVTYGANQTAFTSNGLQNSETIGNLTITASGGTAANATVGNYTLVPSNATGGNFSASNYNITYGNGTLVVGTKNLTVTANNATKSYGDSVTYGAGQTAFTASGLENLETIGNLTITASGGTAANATIGNYTLVPSNATGGSFNATNYNITYGNGTLVVSTRNLTVTANNTTKTYGDSVTYGVGQTAFTSNGLQNSETIGNLTITASGGTAANATVGNYTLVPSGATGGNFSASNYNITYGNGTLVVGTRNLTVTANNATKTYGQNLTYGSGQTAFTANGLQNSETIGNLTITASGGTAASATVGNYTLVPSAATGGNFSASNYNITYGNGTLVVGTKNLTVTANNATKTYGDTVTYGANQTAFTPVGLENSETIGNVTITASGGTAGNAVVGNYTLVPSAAAGGNFSAVNYNITYGNGTLVVGTRNLTVTANNATKTYGQTVSYGANQTAFTSLGLQNSETIGSVTITASGGTAANATSGNYTLTPSLATGGNFSLSNYNVTYSPGTLSVAKLQLTGNFTAANKVYDGTTSATVLTRNLTGVFGSDDVALTGGTATFASAGVGSGKTVTLAGATLAGAQSGNYDLVSVGTTTADISGKTLTILGLKLLARAYDGTTVAPMDLSGISLSGVVGSDRVALVTTSAAARYADPSVGTNKSATGSGFALSGAENLNYVLVQPAGMTGVITAASGGIVIGNLRQTYDGRPKPVAVGFTGATVPVRTTYNGAETVPINAGSYAVRVVPTDANYTGSAEGTLVIEKAGQMLTVTAAPNVTTGTSTAVSATSSAGLTVVLTVASGRATLVNGLLTLTENGTVVLRATQAGNDNYLPATADYSVSAAVINVYLGTVTLANGSTSKLGDLAAVAPPGGGAGTLLVLVPNYGLSQSLNFRLGADGSFEQTFVADVPALPREDTPPTAPAQTNLTVRGRVSGGRMIGTIEPLGLAFDAPVLPSTGPAAGAAGVYVSSAVGGASGSITSIVGANGQALVVASTPAVKAGGLTTLGANGSFSISSGAVSIAGAVNVPATTVTGTITTSGQTADFAGLLTRTLRTDRMVNLSSRVRLSGANAVLITGFVIGGDAPKQVLVRGIGPALAGFGVNGALPNPALKVYRGSELVAQNDDWTAESGAAFSRLGAFSLPAGSKDAALLLTLTPGAYTAHVSDGPESGVVLAEIYDASTNPAAEAQRLVNISSRGEVSSGEGVLVGGFVVTGNAPKRLLIRGVGPALTAFGATGVLADPRLRIYRDSTVLTENDNWSANAAEGTAIAAAAAQAGAFAFTAGSKDAALIISLAPGAYTAQVSSADGTGSGLALVEIYELPE
jgi:hypothetical protein